MKRTICISTAAAMLFTLSGCFLLPAEEELSAPALLSEETAETYQFSYVTRGDLEQWASISCQFQSLLQEHLTFRYEGRPVGTVYVKAGDDVEPGQLLAELENEALDLELERAAQQSDELNAQLELARERLAIVEESYEYSGQLEQYQDTVARLEEDVALADQRLAELTAQRREESIYAGIEGTVSYIRSYTATSTGNDFIVISDRGDACFYANTEYWESLPAGMEVTLSTDEGEITAVVTDAETLGFPTPEVNNLGQKRVYFVPQDELAMMTDSSKAELNLLLNERRDVLIVQSRAVFFAGGQAYVYYENESGIREAKPVEVGLKVSGKYEVLSGLIEGEALVVG